VSSYLPFQQSFVVNKLLFTWTKFYHFNIDIDIPQAKFFFLQSVNIGEGALRFSGGHGPLWPPWLRACRVCHQQGHDDPNCSRQLTWAARLAGSSSMDVENQAKVGPDVALEDIEVDREDDEANFMLTENQAAETAAKSVDAPAVTENTQLHSSSSPPNEGSSSTNEVITQTASEHQAAGADAPAITRIFPSR
jgi:hypothetical protein